MHCINKRMDAHTVAYAVSSTALVALLGVPLVAWRATGDAAFALLIPFGALCAAIVEVIKGHATWSRRPAGANNCSLTCGGGPVGGAPGFPSGHVGMTTAVLMSVVFCLAFDAGGRVTWTALSAAIAVAWIAAMCWSRLTLRCHDVRQVVAGAAFGVAAATVFAACVHLYRHGWHRLRR